MADVSDWSANEKENTHLDELTLSGEGGQYINKLMCAVKKGIDSINNTVVHKTEDESIHGVKTFLNESVMRLDTIDKATPPTDSNVYGHAFFIRDKGNKNLLDVYCKQTTDNNISISFYVSGSGTGGSSININALANNDSAVVFSTGVVRPATSDITSLGTANALWSQVYSANSEISTSDARLKTQLEHLPEEVLDAWGEVSFVQYKMRNSLEIKGDKARLHTGLIAQDILSSFLKHGIDVTTYGLFCHDEWEEEDGVLAGDSYSLRYVEALCLEAAYQRRRADRLEERVSKIEALLNANKQ